MGTMHLLRVMHYTKLLCKSQCLPTDCDHYPNWRYATWDPQHTILPLQWYWHWNNDPWQNNVQPTMVLQHWIHQHKNQNSAGDQHNTPQKGTTVGRQTAPSHIFPEHKWQNWCHYALPDDPPMSWQTHLNGSNHSICQNFTTKNLHSDYDHRTF